LFSLLFSFSPSFSLKEIKQNNKTREKNNKNVGEKKKKTQQHEQSWRRWQLCNDPEECQENNTKH
jgi:hypothetical protein